MDLSVIIVNYNVQHFLALCLQSVFAAKADLKLEVFVVDNNSQDGSVEMVKKHFPEVQLIANRENTGFSVANNQAIKQAKGEYVLLLNPDTVVGENCFKTCKMFMENQPDCGAIGIRMIDGKGNFLPESKRGLPTFRTAFFKMVGLSRLFPRSALFNQYHLGFLDEHKNAQVEVLSGAFMYMRKSALDEAGLLDEQFFMYGEDIDLSYRLTQGSYKNYYLADETIIHYKGESTKKGSLNYVKTFYNAMLIFAQKHFTGSNFSLYNLALKLAVLLSGVLYYLKWWLNKLLLPLLDFIGTYSLIYFISLWWATNVKGAVDYYPDKLTFVILPTYTLVWLLASFYSGAYDKPIRISRLIRGIAAGTAFIALAYAFLPENWRFSRMIILLGAVSSFGQMVFWRWILFRNQWEGSKTDPVGINRIIAADERRVNECLNRFQQHAVSGNFMGYVSAETSQRVDYLGDKQQLPFIIKNAKAHELILDSEVLRFEEIINLLKPIELVYKILPKGSFNLIGSNSKNEAGDLMVMDAKFAIETPFAMRTKRLFDLLIGALLLLCLPLSLLTRKSRLLLSRAFSLIIGSSSLIGYKKEFNNNSLPDIKQGVIYLDDLFGGTINGQAIGRLKYIYAKQYRLQLDWFYLWRFLSP